MELLKYINKGMKYKISLADLMNNDIAIGVQTEEEFNSLYNKLIELSPDKNIAIDKDVWKKYMITHELEDKEMIEDKTMYIVIYHKDCCGFSSREFYECEKSFTIILHEDVEIDYTYDKEYDIWKS